MIKKLIFTLFYCACFINPVFAGRSASESAKIAWGYSDNNKTSTDGSAQSFIISKYVNTYIAKGADVRTHDSQHIVGLVAVTVAEHGAYFCAVDIGCDSKNSISKQNVWMTWNEINSDGPGKCAWLCESGWSGEMCSVNTGDNPIMCDTVNYSTLWADLKAGGGQSTGDVVVLGRSKQSPDGSIIIGITGTMQHGVVAAPIRVQCKNRDNRQAMFENVEFHKGGKKRILCAEGYKLDASGTDCVPSGIDCLAANNNWCSGFPAASYDETTHILESDSAGKCVKYSCLNPKYGFSDDGSRQCIDCGDDPRSGRNTTTGVCLKCETGTIFQRNQCVSTKNYSRTDLVYGKDKTKSSTPIIKLTNQCWTKFMPDEYAECVKKGPQ